MHVTAEVEPVVVAIVIGATFLVAVIVVALIVVARLFTQVNRNLAAVLKAIGQMPPEVGPTEQALDQINTDLKAAQDLLEGIRTPKGAEPE